MSALQQAGHCSGCTPPKTYSHLQPIMGVNERRLMNKNLSHYTADAVVFCLQYHGLKATTLTALIESQVFLIETSERHSCHYEI